MTDERVTYGERLAQWVDTYFKRHPSHYQALGISIGFVAGFLVMGGLIFAVSFLSQESMPRWAWLFAVMYGLVGAHGGYQTATKTRRELLDHA